MQEYRDINNTRYIVSRVFSENKTTAMLIEQRVKDKKSNVSSLERNDTMMYNINSGSIQSKEGL